MARRTQKNILHQIITLGRATEHHLTPFRSVSVPNSNGANKLRATDLHIKRLLEKGFIEKVPNHMVKRETARWQYYQATDDGYSFMNMEQHRDYGFFSIGKNPEHQHGLMTCLASLYPAYQGDMEVEHGPRADKYGYNVDAVVHPSDHPSLLVEFESSKGFNELVNDIRTRDKKLKIPKDWKILYILNNTRNANKNSRNFNVMEPSRIHDIPDPDMERKTEKFLADLLYELRDLPSYRYRFACFHEFQHFHESVWRAPGKRESFKIH